jgi:hypothetical protein
VRQIESIKALVGLLPNAQALSWDMALHGTHLDITRRLGLTDIVKVNKTAARAGKKIPPPKDDHGKRRTGHVFRLCDGTTQELALYTYDGHPHMEVIAEGKKHKLPLAKTRLRRVEHRSDGYRRYGDYTTPDDARVPAPLRGAMVVVRLDRTKDDGKYNRAELLRPITIHDPPVQPNPDPDHHSEFDQRYVPRPGAESINRWYKQRFTDGRAPAVGRHRIEFMPSAAQSSTTPKPLSRTNNGADKQPEQTFNGLDRLVRCAAVSTHQFRAANMREGSRNRGGSSINTGGTTRSDLRANMRAVPRRVSSVGRAADL